MQSTTRRPGALAVGVITRQADAMGNGAVAFVCAMPMELAPLARDLALVETTIDGVSLHRGTLADRAVVAIVTGMGTALATAGIEALLDVVAVDHVLVVGITGALENETPIATLVLPEVVVDAASGREHRPVQIGDAGHQGRMWTGNTLITDHDELADLRARGVIALDMETAALARVCEARAVPWSVFRAISDRAGDGTVDAEVFAMSNQDGTPNHEAIAAFFERHPDRIPMLAQMAEDSTAAAERAAAAAIEAATHL